MPIYSNQVEGHVLGGLLKHPDVLPEVDSFVGAADFYNDVHQTIYCILRESILNGEKIDKVLVATKISNLGISSKDDIDIYDYINTLSYTSITRDAVIGSCKELVKYRIRRELSDTADRRPSPVRALTHGLIRQLLSKEAGALLFWPCWQRYFHNLRLQGRSS